MPIFTVFPSWELPWALCPQAQQPRCSPEAKIAYGHLDIHQRKPLVKKFWNFVHTAQIFAKIRILHKISIFSKIEYNHSRSPKREFNLRSHFIFNLFWIKSTLVNILDTSELDFRGKLTTGSRSNFRLQNWKMASNKRHHTIKFDFVIPFDFEYFMTILFWDNGWNNDIRSKFENFFRAVLNHLGLNSA